MHVVRLLRRKAADAATCGLHGSKLRARGRPVIKGKLSALKVAPVVPQVEETRVVKRLVGGLAARSAVAREAGTSARGEPADRHKSPSSPPHLIHVAVKVLVVLRHRFLHRTQRSPLRVEATRETRRAQPTHRPRTLTASVMREKKVG